jgi:WD40 repeat protein
MWPSWVSRRVRDEGARSRGQDFALRLWAIARPPRKAAPEGDDVTVELLALEGHTDEVRCVFTADGQSALTAGRDGVVCLWDLGTGREARRFKGDAGPVQSLALSADGTRAVTGSANGLLVLWDVKSGTVLRRSTPNYTVVSGLALAPDGRHFFAASGYTLSLWETENLRWARYFTGHFGVIDSVAYSPDGKLALSAGQDRQVLLWDGRTGKVVRRLIGHTDAVTAAAFSPDGTRVLSAGNDGTLRLWEATTGRPLRRYSVPSGAILSVALLLPEGAPRGGVRQLGRAPQIPRGDQPDPPRRQDRLPPDGDPRRQRPARAHRPGGEDRGGAEEAEADGGIPPPRGRGARAGPGEEPVGRVPEGRRLPRPSREESQG